MPMDIYQVEAQQPGEGGWTTIARFISSGDDAHEAAFQFLKIKWPVDAYATNNWTGWRRHIPDVSGHRLVVTSGPYSRNGDSLTTTVAELLVEQVARVAQERRAADTKLAEARQALAEARKTADAARDRTRWKRNDLDEAAKVAASAGVTASEITKAKRQGAQRKPAPS